MRSLLDCRPSGYKVGASASGRRTPRAKASKPGLADRGCDSELRVARTRRVFRTVPLFRGCRLSGQRAPIARFICRYAPDLVLAPGAICGPPVRSVERCGSRIADQHPEDGLSKATVAHVLTRLADQPPADSEPPAAGIDIEREQLAEVDLVGAGCWTDRGESAESSVIIDGDQGYRAIRRRAFMSAPVRD